MREAYPAGRVIERFAGLLESSTDDPPVTGYTGVIAFDDGSVLLLAQSDFAALSGWPTGAVPLPVQVLDGEGINGQRVRSAFRTAARVGLGKQLYFLLHDQRIMGLVNTQRGTVLHVESALTAPDLRGDPELWDLQEARVSLDKLLLV